MRETVPRHCGNETEDADRKAHTGDDENGELASMQARKAVASEHETRATMNSWPLKWLAPAFDGSLNRVP